MENSNVKPNGFSLATTERSDKLMNYFLPGYFFLGLVLAAFYGTWVIAIGVGGLCLLAYYAVKFLLPQSALYQYVLSAVLGIFMAQFIYQMHGLFEMHFFAFIGSAVLITYQKWKLQIPMLIVVFIHHACFSYLQDIGIGKIYFTQLDYFDLQTFIIHILLTVVIFFICGLWAYQLKKYNELHIEQAVRMLALEKDAELFIERMQYADTVDRLNKELQLQANELSVSNTELEQFAYVASHDLQEPLRMITSFLTQLEHNYAHVIDDKGLKFIHFAVDGAQRMRHIIVDLLEYSRAGKTGDKLEEIDLHDIITGIISLHQKQITDFKAQIEIPALPTIYSFKSPVRQVFQNLIANALKYQKDGSKPVINISCREEDSFWEFAVKDNGIGISAAHFDCVFILFQRLNAPEKYPGTGMGLAVTKKIIDQMKGKIWVESEEGKGSAFYFTLPKITPSTDIDFFRRHIYDDH